MTASPKYSIYNLRFPSQYLMTSTLMRVEEFYESPRFKNQVFTHEEYMDWYAHTRGSMSYFNDWNGFNIPSQRIEEFATLFHPLSEKERRLVNLLRRTVPDRREYYLVATCDNDRETLAHEVVHGLFSLYCGYQMAVCRALRNFDLDAPYAALRKMGYDDSVLEDELNAYALTGLPKALNPKKLDKVRKELLTLFAIHFGVNLTTAPGVRKLLGRIHTLDWGVGDAVRSPSV